MPRKITAPGFATVVAALLFTLGVVTVSVYPPRVAFAAQTAIKTQKKLYRGFAISAPGANTDAIDDVTWQSNDSFLRVALTLDQASVVKVMVTRGGSTEPVKLNGGTAVPAGDVGHVFDVHGLKYGDTLNFQVETDTAIGMLSFDEVF